MSVTVLDHRTGRDMYLENRKLIENIKPGYYAVRRGDTDSFDFIRISTPEFGQLKGAFKVQTQHGPWLQTEIVDRRFRSPEGDYFSGLWSARQCVSILGQASMVRVLLELSATVPQSGIAYAQEKGRCMRCNTELTDARSRWYGFGAECEKALKETKDFIHMTRGFFEDREIEIDY